MTNDRESRRKELQKKLDKVWDSVSPPIPEEELTGKWYAIVVSSKRQKTLYFAKIVQRILRDEDGPVNELEMPFLMPKYGSGDVVEDTLDHLLYDIGMVKNELIAGTLKLNCKPRERKCIV